MNRKKKRNKKLNYVHTVLKHHVFNCSDVKFFEISKSFLLGWISCSLKNWKNYVQKYYIYV